MIERQSFPRRVQSVPEARHFVTAVISSQPAEVIERAAVIVSELATNAVQHAGTEFTVQVEVKEDLVSIEIVDAGLGVPRIKDAEPHELSGRGLKIVDMMADSWGVRDADDNPGKTVWFYLSLRTSSSVH